MNKWEKEVLESLLDSEAETLKELEKQYSRALNDIGQKVKAFQADIDMLDAAIQSDGIDEKAKELLKSQRRSKVYQKQYQEALQGQVSGILDQMQGNNYTTIESYLKQSYEDAYIGTMYDIHNQGVPIITPIDQASAVKAVLTDSKISKGLYNALGVDVAGLKKSISAEITRGIASSLPYADIARNLNNVSKAGYSNAKRIVVTEGHRIQQTSANDARQAAKSKGADVVKQWDAALDGKTRDTHRKLDGQIREVDEPFEVDGKKAMFPGDFGDPAEDCNCRCTADTRARWALDEDELKTLQERAAYFGLDKTKDFEDFKKKFIHATEQESKTEIKFVPAKTVKEAEEYAKQFADSVDYNGLSIKRVNEINEKLADLFAKHPGVQRYERIDQKPPKGAVAGANGKVLSINKSKGSTNQSNFFAVKAANEAEIRHLKEVIETGIEYGRPVSNARIKIAKETIEKKMEYNRFERFNVTTNQGDVISHEFGHTLAEQLTGTFIRSTPYEYLNDKNKMIVDTFAKAKDSEYIFSLSKYASTNADEFFAECFCANEMGEQLPQYIIDMLKFVEG